MSSLTTTEGDKRGQSDGAGTGGPKPEQSGTRNKKLRRGEGAPRGASGGKILNDKRQNEVKHKQEGVQGKGIGETVEKKKRLLSEKAGTTGKAQYGKGVGAVILCRLLVCVCKNNRIRSTCKDCGGVAICEHNRIRSRCKECDGSSICEHNRHRHVCKDCGGAVIYEHNLRRHRCKQCGGEGGRMEGENLKDKNWQSPLLDIPTCGGVSCALPSQLVSNPSLISL
jgi:hypothetical protein